MPAQSSRVKQATNALAIVGLVVLAWITWFALDEQAQATPAVVEGEPPRPRDVILVTVDTLRADRVGVYSDEESLTPRMDEWAARGTTFMQATVPFPRTTPALASLMTGLWAHHHGSREVWQKIEHGRRLAQVLEARGYATLAVSGNSAAGSKQGLGEGFDKYVNRKDFKLPWSHLLSKKALQLVDKYAKDKPLFLWVHYFDPHWEYKTPTDVWDNAPDSPKCKRIMRERKTGKITLSELFQNERGLAEDAHDDCVAMYEDAIAFTDSQIGALLDGLEKRRGLDDALVIITADHGESIGEKNLWFQHGPSVHDASMKVPLIMAGPGIPPGRRDPGVARLEDVMPTVLDLLGVEREKWPKMDGSELTWRWDPEREQPDDAIPVALIESGTALRSRMNDYLVSGRTRERNCINGPQYSLCREKTGDDWKLYDHDEDPGKTVELDPADYPDAYTELRAATRVWKAENARRRAARTPRFKLVEYPELDGTYRRELYDLRADPSETKDVSELFPDEAAHLEEVLERWAEDAPLFTPSERSEEDLAELRALGYIQ